MADETALIDIRKMRPVLDQISGKWTLLVLIVLCAQPARFNQIMRRLEGITHKALSETLKRLEEGGFIHREVLPTKPVGVEYSITPLGQSLRGPFDAVYEWALEHADAVGPSKQD
ncbi:winged helix-turn-helix transcriptional regulator [Rhizobium halophytocola]|uniref:DNA-binding HxlR family transcriptional regulator n=1 Tax=Rhizobium halophytocola TaxID=735519 RepID=A0ABS4DZY1_9HYPH|nr:helix-turn-helix domain-containing protein [Rhizobium halophytocola]MBP1851247.1 DNA-binding HxlR family transcriptional regulator [Rhizobium halophytocola]